ncbi:FAD dependent oxidoreductase [Cooperia oncophora]
MANVNEKFDVVVVGAGIFGSCTAYHCQKLGLKTLLLEKYELGHINGSSHGLSRIIRYAHTDSAYVPLVNDSYGQIEELEKKIGENLWRRAVHITIYLTREPSGMKIKGTMKIKGSYQGTFGQQVNGIAVKRIDAVKTRILFQSEPVGWTS